MPSSNIRDGSLHLLIEPVKQHVPEEVGVVVLYDSNDTALSVEWGQMRAKVLEGHGRHPEATKFRLHYKECNGNGRCLEELAESLREKHHLCKEPGSR